MKKIFLSLLLLMGAQGVTKSMDYRALPAVGAVIAGAPTAVCAMHDIYCGTGNFADRVKRSGAWIARGVVIGAYVGLTFAPMIACGDLLPLSCTEESMILAAMTVAIPAALENVIRYTNAIIRSGTMQK
jgi:hypothetical protein